MHEYGQDAQAGHESYYSKWERPWERLVDVRHTHTHMSGCKGAVGRDTWGGCDVGFTSRIDG